MDRVTELAGLWGIEHEYFDAHGQRRQVDDEALAKIVEAVSFGQAPPERRIPPVAITRADRQSYLKLPHLPQGASVAWTVRLHGSTVATGTWPAGHSPLPRNLAPGTYQLDVCIHDGRTQERQHAILLAAPDRAWQGEGFPPGGRSWALAVQLYGVRSRRNWGHGDFTDLARLIELVGSLGGGGVGVNPLHALFLDRPDQASPYAPNSRLFLNPLYIDVEAVPEFPGLEAAGLAGEVERLRGHDMVDYTGVAAAKRQALARAHRHFLAAGDAARKADFEAFRAERGASLLRFAGFEVLRARHPQVWWEWPPEWRSPDDAGLAALRDSAPDEFGLHEFMQWIADRQLRACRDRAEALGLPVGIYADLAVGVDAGGADAWSEQTAMLPSLSLGAPPDLLNTAGQNWGIVGFNPAALAAQAFAPFRRLLDATMRHAGAMRLDHVLGLKRIFVIPHGFVATRGAYLDFPFEALLAVVAQESVRKRCIVIGEDLGTVPEGFRDRLSDWGIWRYLVMLFERRHDGSFLPPQAYPESALVTFSTHDLPTFTGWWSRHDMQVKHSLGIDPGETDEQRTKAHTALAGILREQGLGEPDILAATRLLARTPSRLMMVAIEDVLGLADQPNLPGTMDEHPNWRRRLPVDLEDIAGDPRLHAIAQALAETGRSLRA